MPTALTNDNKREIFLDLKNLSIPQVGYKYGFDRYYKNKASMKTKVRLIQMEVLSNPVKFGITQEVADDVAKSIHDRKRLSGLIQTSPSQSPEELKKVDEYGELEIKDLIGLSKKKSWIVLNKKLDTLMKSKAQVLKTPISMLAQVAGIVFDKGQIVKGEATEHIALHARVDKNLSPQDKMELLQKLRERIAEKDKSEYQKIEENKNDGDDNIF